MNKTWRMIGIIIGALAILFGIVILFMESPYSYLEYTAFGADFYTYSYRATRAAALSIISLFKIVKYSLGFLLIVIGGAVMCYFGGKDNQKIIQESNESPAETTKMTDESPETELVPEDEENPETEV